MSEEARSERKTQNSHAVLLDLLCESTIGGRYVS
jgi:hypothetical protein